MVVYRNFGMFGNINFTVSKSILQVYFTVYLDTVKSILQFLKVYLKVYITVSKSIYLKDLEKNTLSSHGLHFIN